MDGDIFSKWFKKQLFHLFFVRIRSGDSHEDFLNNPHARRGRNKR